MTKDQSVQPKSSGEVMTKRSEYAVVMEEEASRRMRCCTFG